MKELSCPLILLVLCIVGIVFTLTSCATYTVRIPIGSNEQYGAVDVGVTYYPPRDFSERLHDFLPANPFRPTSHDGKAALQ